MKLKTLTTADIQHKKVLVRADFDVPLKRAGESWVVADDSRLVRTVETIQFITKNQGTCLMMGHLGRPDGKKVNKYSFKPIAHHLEKLLDRQVVFIAECIGAETAKMVAALPPGSVAVLENLRFHPGEQANDSDFARELASLADVFVNEAFATAHRAHASIVGVPRHLPSFAGFSFAEEVATFHSLMTKPKRPFVMVIGGAKISDKVKAVEHLTKIADAVLVGGGVANNFLKADGFDIDKSYLQDTPADLKKKGVNYVDLAENLIKDTKQDRLLKDGYIPLPKIIYPIDVIAAKSPESTSGSVVELVNGNHQEATKKGMMYLDIGPKTIKLFQEIVLQAGTVFWNGPMGVFESSTFANGTREVARAIAKSSATTILGGGDTIAAVSAFGLDDRFDYVSGAGGAALEFLSGKTLPGVEPLLAKE